MRLKIHESTVKSMAKMTNNYRMVAVDDLGTTLYIFKRGHFVVVDFLMEDDE